MTEYTGSCYCGAVKILTKGDPLFTQYCHCNKCREIASRSKNSADKKGYGFTAAYLKSMFSIVSGENKLEKVQRNNSNLFLCMDCGGLIYGISQDPLKQAGIGININNFKFPEGKIPETFKPDKHIWYQDRVNDIDDNLLKYKDTPVDQFGSGELISK